MKFKILVPFALGLVASTFSMSAFPQSQPAPSVRIVNDTLIYKDPTVSAPGKWIFGAAAEESYEIAPIKTANIDGLLESGHMKSSKPGISVFSGYDDITINYTYRKGNENISFPSAVSSDTQQNSTKENEIALRWRISALDSTWVSPYVYAGYVDMTVNTVDTITSPPGAYWASVGGVNRSPVGTSTTRWKGSMAGVGGIIPYSKVFGFRADGGLISAHSNWASEFGPSAKGNGLGWRFTGTMYYNIYQGLNAQVGGRYEYLNGGDSGIVRYRSGVFAMLGYVFK